MLSQRDVGEVDLLRATILVLDGLRDAHNLHRRAGAVIQTDMLSQGVTVRPVVFGKVVVHDRNARRFRGVGGPEISAAQNGNSHGREEPFIDGV